MKLPSLHNENPITLKCKFFGCKEEEPSHLILNYIVVNV